MTEQNVPVGTREIVAKAYWWYLVSRYTLAVILIGYGAFSLYDGFVRYPNDQRDAISKGVDADKLPHRGLDIPFNKTFGIGLPPLGVAFAIFAWFNSRGRIRFDGTTLTAPVTRRFRCPLLKRSIEPNGIEKASPICATKFPGRPNQARSN